MQEQGFLYTLRTKLYWPVMRWFRRHIYWLIYPKTVTLTHLPDQPLNFEIFSDVEVFRTLHYGGERDVLDAFAERLDAHDIVFDIGASIGLFTLTAAALANQGQVFAFEPDPHIRNRMIHNAGLNSLVNITPVKWAVGDTAGTTTLFTQGVDGSSPSLRRSRNLKRSTPIDVQIKGIDEAISSGELPLPTVLKIDIEGAELLALRGMLRLLRGELGTPPRFFMLEVHPVFLKEFQAKRDDVMQLLMALSAYKQVYAKIRSDEEIYIYQAI